MTLRARLALGLSAAALVAGVLLTRSGAPDARPGRPRAELEPVEPIAAVLAAPVESAAADVRLEEARSESAGRRAIAEGASMEPGEREDWSPGVLRVHVRARDTGELLSGVHVVIKPVRDASQSSARSDEATPSIEAERTDEDGPVEFEVPPGVSYALRATRAGIYDDVAEQSVPALSPAETREIVLELPTADLPFVGRAVAAETGEPLPGASFSIDRSLRGSTDENGYFEARVPSWKALWVTLVAPGYARAVAGTRRGHESRATPLVFRLQRSARLCALVLARDGTPLEDVEVRLETSSRNVEQSSFAAGGPLYPYDLQWNGKTEADGRCSVGDLPPRVLLEVECWTAGLRHREADLLLSPGEVREVVFRIGSGATVSGRLIDADGANADGVRIWLRQERISAPGYSKTNSLPEATTVTAAGGRFEFADVADGTWWVGPPRGGPYPASAAVVEVIDGVPDRTVLLHVQRGLFVEGRVVDPAGAPVEKVFICLSDEQETPWPMDGTPADVTDASGEFLVGPVARGSYILSAEASGWVRTEGIGVEAGDRGLVVRLEPGGWIRGTLVDGESGAPAHGLVTVRAAGVASGSLTDEAGRFEIERLAAGLYHVSATTAGRGFAQATDVAVVAGVPPPDLLLRTRPGALLHVRYAGARSHGSFDVLIGDAVVASASVKRDGLVSRVVPAGSLRVECSWEGCAEPEVHELTLAVGEERELVFGSGE
jgi:hypothetical protein